MKSQQASASLQASQDFVIIAGQSLIGAPSSAHEHVVPLHVISYFELPPTQDA